MSPSSLHGGGLSSFLLKATAGGHFDRFSVLLLAGAYAASFLAILLVAGLGLGIGYLRPGDEVPRDLVADRDAVYVDEAATALRREAEERLVLPVFIVDDRPVGEAIASFESFRDLILGLVEKGVGGESLYLKAQSERPGLVERDALRLVEAFPKKAEAFSRALEILSELMAKGIASLPSSGLERYNPDFIELRRWKEGRLEQEELPVGRLPTMRQAERSLQSAIEERRLAKPLVAVVATLVRPFLAESAFFDAGQSERKLEAARERVEPVVKRIAKGELVAGRGALVTDEVYQKIRAMGGERLGWRFILGNATFLALVLAIAVLLLARSVSGCHYGKGMLVLIVCMAVGYFVLSLVVERFVKLPPNLPIAVLLPGAMIASLMSIMISARFGALYSVVIGLLAFLAPGMDGTNFAFVFFSSLAGTFSVREAEKRIDLMRAAAILALAQAGIAGLVSVFRPLSVADVFASAFWFGLNGFVCGVLSLGSLPILEQALNAPTRFRLMELSDLNAPILKRLLTAAPGTYSHSVTVAHMAESACREIGANALLARVGAYYHDIGKIEQPEYFTENQAGLNKHDAIQPRLSVTVIRSHVKLGVEKARALRLPDEVVDIIAQHHGNAIIAWFYDKAQKAGAEPNPEDYSYPGQPPATKEAAVVMLADTVEAATRSLKRPTMSRIEEFSRELFMDKLRSGQLDSCDLTLNEMDKVRDAFTRILAGHFHTRVEYPKAKESAR